MRVEVTGTDAARLDTISTSVDMQIARSASSARFDMRARKVIRRFNERRT